MKKLDYFCRNKKTNCQMSANKRTKAYIRTAILLTALMLAGCKERSSDAGKIYRRSASGVVFVSNRYYYSVNAGGKILYFSGVSAEGEMLDLTDNTDTITAKARTATGSGFLLDSHGNILTTRSLARPEIAGQTVEKVKEKAIGRIRSFLENASLQTLRQYNDVCSLIEAQKNRIALPGSHTSDSIGELYLKSRQLKALYNGYRKDIDNLEDINGDKLIINCASNVHIAFHKSKTSDAKSRVACNVTKVSGMNNTDLAVIQLKSRRTPRGKYKFHFLGKKRGKRTMLETAISKMRADRQARKLKSGTELCMIGFVQNPDTATQVKTIKAQLSKGVITGQPGENAIAYTFSAAEASNGSPVMNMFGDVVCVNAVKTGGKDTTVYGIPLNHIKEFLGLER